MKRIVNFISIMKFLVYFTCLLLLTVFYEYNSNIYLVMLLIIAIGLELITLLKKEF